MSVHDPLSRKRSLSGPNILEGTVTKKLKNEEEEEATLEKSSSSNHAFSEKMYHTYVKSALESLDKNDSLPVDSLTSKISLPITHNQAISVSNFNIVLKILISNVSRLDNGPCNSLISAILDYNWLELKPVDESDNAYSSFIDLYSQFLSVLVSSLPKYLHEVTSKLVREFTSINTENNSSANHHTVLNKIMKFIPTSVNSLPGTLQKNFPHHLSSSTEELTNYVGNLIKILTYCLELQYDIWQLIIECCIKLDVELQNELDDLDDDEIEALINDDEVEEDSDCEDDDEDDNSSIDSDDEDDDIVEGEVEYLIDPVTSTVNTKMLLKKLDSIIHLLLTNTSGSFSLDELNNGNGVYLFNTITSLFKTHILPTHFTKLIQFTLFHISQYQPELADSFLVLLIDVAFNTTEILEKRLKAMQYLSSYIARAKNLSRHQIVFVASYLIGWLNKYVIERECEITDYENDNKGRSTNIKQGGGMERFKLFYAAFQALLYIFCFRYKMLYKVPGSTDSSSDSEWECDIDKFFQRVIIAKFNPLKFCDETVVYIFAKIATKLNVCYCYSIIEHNKRERMLQTNGAKNLPSAVGNFKQKQEFLDLEAYFPFDPLVLPKCKLLIGQNYIEWSDVNPSNEEDDDEDSGSHPEEDLSESDDDISSDDNDE